MPYLMIDDIDFSACVNGLKVSTSHNFTSQTNAAGDTVVDYINSKRTIEVGIIPLNDTKMKELQEVINSFSVSLSFLNPNTNELETDVACIIPSNDVEYYTIQANKVLYNAFTLTFTEL